MFGMHSHSIATRTLLAISAVTLFAGVFSLKASQPDPKVLAFTLPDKIPWVKNAGGAEQAVLAGDPSKPGLYVVLTKWTPHHMRWVGTGSKYDPDSTTPIPAGSFVTHYGKQIHYDGAKDEEVTLEIVGMGPATSTPAETK
jgi:hypothetical protein